MRISRGKMARMNESQGYYTVAHIRGIERQALSQLPPGTLMQRAAAAIADQADQMLRQMDPRARAIGLIGPGNNGGDALLALQLLARRGYATAAFALNPQRPGAADAAAVHDTWIAGGAALHPLEALPATLAAVEFDDLLIDGLFGIGLSGPLGGAAAHIAQLTFRSSAPVLSVDVPSGINADTGAVIGGLRASAVKATCTVTMIGAKPGLHTGRGLELAGEVRLASLSLDTGLADGLRIDREWVASRLQPRRRGAHKGSFGTLAILGGAEGMRGAALLAGLAGRASGAGKVALLGPDGPVFDPGEPQLMAWTLARPADLEQRLKSASAAVIGCGLGTGLGSRTLFTRALSCDLPAVIDADGLNLIAQTDHAPLLSSSLQERAARRPTVLTPHPLEAARLLGCTVAQVESDRIASARQLAAQTNSTVLLKGAGTILAAPDGRWALIASGNPALATGGTGDILSGVVGALLAQGYSAWKAAAIAAWVHGHAADQWQAHQPRAIGLSSEALLAGIVDVFNHC